MTKRQIRIWICRCTVYGYWLERSAEILVHYCLNVFQGLIYCDFSCDCLLEGGLHLGQNGCPGTCCQRIGDRTGLSNCRMIGSFRNTGSRFRFSFTEETIVKELYSLPMTVQ